ncbi:MAG: hypothetical protein R3C27_12055 [Hyphomonadaceae bacterium]
MWAKSALLSALFAAGLFAAPDAADARVQGAPHVWVQPIQHDRGGQQELRSIREVVEQLRSQYGGEYVSHRLEQGGSPVYVVRWRMPDGQIRDIRVSASR